MTFFPWPAMMPERMGTIGSTQGVKANTRPARKKPPNIRKVLPEVMREAKRSCSETKPVGAALTEGPAVTGLGSSALLAAPLAAASAPTLLEVIAWPTVPGDPAPAFPDGRLTVISFVIGG